MKTITIRVEDTLHRALALHARLHQRTVSEVAHEALQTYLNLGRRPTLHNHTHLDLGQIIRPLSPHDDRLGEMVHV